MKTRNRLAAGMACKVGTLAGTRRQVFTQPRDGVLVHGPSGSGKTWSLAYHLTVGAPHALVASTTKGDLPAATYAERAARGRRVHVFDPEQLLGWPDPVRWSPLAGCEDPDTAIRRADALTNAMPLKGTTNGGYFEAKAATLLRCYLHAAALDGATISEVRAWIPSRRAEKPRDILEASTVPDWLDDLALVLDSPSDSSADVINACSRLLDPLASPNLRLAVDIPHGVSFDPESFLRQGETLYLVSRGKSRSMAPFVAALVAEVHHVADRLSQSMPGKRWDPSVRFVLDEMNNVAPLPDLPDILTDSGGRGITVWCFAHNQAQNVERWGQSAGRQLKASAPVHLVLPGLNDIDELDALSRIIGRRREWVKTPAGGQLRDDYLLSPDRIRELPDNTGLLLYRNAGAILCDLDNVWGSRKLRRRVLHSMDAFDAIVERGSVAAPTESTAVEATSL